MSHKSTQARTAHLPGINTQQREIMKKTEKGVISINGL